MFTGPNIIQDEISLMLDPGNSKSYPGTGTIIFDLSGNERNSTSNGASLDLDGNLVFEGQGERDGSPLGDYISLDTNATTTSPSVKPDGVTYSTWMVFDANQPQGHGIFVGSGTINHLEWRGTITGGSGWRTEAKTQNGYSFGGGGESNYGYHSIGKWFNLSLVFANDEVNRPVRWYMDGELFHTGNMTGGNNPSGEYFIPSRFGSATGSSNFLYAQSFYGRLGNLTVYDRTLTETEVKRNYNAFKSRFV
jgi:hypothetical protein